MVSVQSRYRFEVPASPLTTDSMVSNRTRKRNCFYSWIPSYGLTERITPAFIGHLIRFLHLSFHRAMVSNSKAFRFAMWNKETSNKSLSLRKTSSSFAGIFVNNEIVIPLQPNSTISDSTTTGSGCLFGAPLEGHVHGAPGSYLPRYTLLAWQESFAATQSYPVALSLPKRDKPIEFLWW